MHERHARLLGRLAELGMALAEDLHARARAADTPQEAETLASGFHKLSRSVRQSLALEARLRATPSASAVRIKTRPRPTPPRPQPAAAPRPSPASTA